MELNTVAMKSMTGYGAASLKAKDVTLEVLVRAVNGRYLETRFHLPKELLQLEPKIKKECQSWFVRGSVDVFINRRLTDESRFEVRVQYDVAKQAHIALEKLGRSLRLRSEIDLGLLLRSADILKVEEKKAFSEGEEKQLLKLLKQAIKACHDERSREGLSLKKNLQMHLKQLLKLTEELHAGAQKHQLALKDKYKETLALSVPESERERLLVEVSHQVERADIHEEISRLREHIRVFSGLLLQREPQGKKMDFYCQELLRETNTIGSKVLKSELTKAVVEAKTIIERIREQVQNVE